MKNNRIDMLFLAFPILILFNLIIAWSFKDYLTPDSHNYIEIAQKLPNIENSIFPLLYPLVLKLVNTLFGDFLITYKVVNVGLLIFSFAFTYFKNFFWKEIWFMLTFASFLTIFRVAWSENLIIPILIVYFYYYYEFLNSRINARKFIIRSAICLILTMLTKYNSIFFVIGPAVLAFILYFKNSIKFLPIVLVNIIAILIFFFYLIVNKFFTGYLMGPRGSEFELGYPTFLYLSVMNIITTLDPLSISLIKIFYLRPDLIFWKIPYIFSTAFTVYVIYFLIKNKLLSYFTILCFSTAFSFLIGSLISGYFTRIDVISARLSLGFYLPFLFGLISVLSIKNFRLNSIRIFVIGIISIALDFITIYYNGYV